MFREVDIQLPDGTVLRLLTTLRDLPAATIVLLTQQRWQIELFFRWLKCYAGFHHLISHRSPGVLLNFYVVVIGILLTYLQTGGRPSKYLFALLGAVASGGATLDEILPILRERERQSALARARRRPPPCKKALVNSMRPDCASHPPARRRLLPDKISGHYCAEQVPFAH